MGLFDVVANVATLGGYGIGKAVYEELQERDKEKDQASSSGAGGNSADIAGDLANKVPEQKYCCFVIEGDYLLNSETGQVWLIDKGKMALLPIKHSKFRVESIATAITLERTKQYLLNKKDMEIAQMEHSVRAVFSKRIDTLIKVLDEEIDSHMKAATKP